MRNAIEDADAVEELATIRELLMVVAMLTALGLAMAAVQILG